jgi:2'-5' RNA ligase
MTDHWWWRPGWRPGRRMYYWHVTFPEAPAVQAFAAAARERLAGLPGMDLVPGHWLHLTIQRIGFTDEVSDGDLAAIADAGRARLARVAPPEVIIGPAQVQGEGIVCDANPAEALAPVRDAARAAIGDVWGPARVPGRSHWWPHVSLGYASAAGPAGPFEAALAGFADVAAHTVSAIRLIRLGRDDHQWEWDVCATVPLARP